jgi:UDP-glucose 4-epimerase
MVDSTGKEKMVQEKIFITGGLGFLGSNLTLALLEKGNRVAVYDNLFTGKREFLGDLADEIELFENDIRDGDAVVRAMQAFRPTVVFHLAALHYIPYCNANPLETIEVNVKGTEAVLQAIKKTDSVRKLVYASTAAVYSISDRPHRESSETNPVDIYGNTKYFGEHLVRTFCEETGVQCYVARLFNIYGPHETNPHVIPAILEQLRDSTEIFLGNLHPKRDYIYVQDVVEALLCMNGLDNGSFYTFNVGTGQEFSVQELVEAVERIIQKKITIRQDEKRTRKVDRLHLVADITRLQEATGWQPRYDLQSGLRSLIQAEYPELLES